MQQVRTTTRVLGAAMSLASLSALAAGPETGCHTLMTEKECSAYRSAYVSLPLGEARDRFLAEHAALMKEREALCNCNRANADTVILYPRVIQKAQRT